MSCAYGCQQGVYLRLAGSSAASPVEHVETEHEPTRREETMIEECGACDGTGAACQHCGYGPETCECGDFTDWTCSMCHGEGVLLP
jgi:hypothetical protein